MCCIIFTVLSHVSFSMPYSLGILRLPRPELTRSCISVLQIWSFFFYKRPMSVSYCVILPIFMEVIFYLFSFIFKYFVRWIYTTLQGSFILSLKQIIQVTDLGLKIQPLKRHFKLTKKTTRLALFSTVSWTLHKSSSITQIVIITQRHWKQPHRGIPWKQLRIYS